MSERPPTSSGETSVRLEADRFYWALLDAGSVIGFGWDQRRHRLGYLLEGVLPVSLEDLHVVFEDVRVAVDAGSSDTGTMPERRVLACAIDRRALTEHLERGAITLGPQSLPPFLRLDGVDPGELNLLTGPFEPASVRSARVRWAWRCGACLAACLLLVLIGLQRRVGAAGADAFAAQQAQVSLYAQVLAPARTGDMLPSPLRLEAELRRLRQTRTAPSAETRPLDASLTLARLLERWPKNVAIQTETLTMSQGAIRLVSSVPTHAAAQTLGDQLRGVQGWRMGQPQVSASKSTVRVTITWSPQEGAPP